MHGLTYGQISRYAYIIVGDKTSYLIVIVGIYEADVCFQVLIKYRAQLILDFFIHILQKIDSVVRIHLIYDFCQPAYTQLLYILLRFLYIRENIGYPLRIKTVIQHLSLFLCQQLQTLGNVLVMVIFQSVDKLLSAITTSYYNYDILCKCWFLQYLFHHSKPPFSLKKGIKKPS